MDNEQPTRRRDLTLFVILIALAFTGLFFLYPASSVTALRETGDGAGLFLTQLSRFVPGLLLMLLLAVVPLRILQGAAAPALLAAFLLLLLVFVPGVGHSVSSSDSQSFRRWIELGSVRFQPSEFAKVAFVLYIARTLALHSEPEGIDWRRLRLPGVLLLLVLGAILVEPQFGTTVCMGAVLLALLVLGGLRWRALGALGLAAAPVLLALAYAAPYRWSRVRVWLEPYRYRHEGGYQLVTSFRAFSEGGLVGEELAQGFAHRYLTYGHTDFVLALVGENFGFLGVLLLVGLYGLLLWRAAFLLRRTDNRFAFLVGSGALLMLLFQALLNMGVVTGLLPTTGVSLPFVSFGGSSLIASLMFGGLLLNASRFSEHPQRSVALRETPGYA